MDRANYSNLRFSTRSFDDVFLSQRWQWNLCLKLCSFFIFGGHETRAVICCLFNGSECWKAPRLLFRSNGMTKPAMNRTDQTDVNTLWRSSPHYVMPHEQWAMAENNPQCFSRWECKWAVNCILHAAANSSRSFLVITENYHFACRLIPITFHDDGYNISGS